MGPSLEDLPQPDSRRSTCLSPFCGARVPFKATHCPKCGRPMLGDANIAQRGWHVLMLGLIMAGVMGAVTWFTAPTLLGAIGGAPDSTFRGSGMKAAWMLAAFVALASTGVGFIATSVRMINARSSRATTSLSISLFLAGVLLVVMALITN